MDQSFHHRTVRRSNESIELQPLHLTSSSSGIKTPKGVLRRMPRVRSDEMTNEDYRQPSVDKSPSPIGAGLPLLQRLRMLKEKQVTILILLTFANHVLNIEKLFYEFTRITNMCSGSHS